MKSLTYAACFFCFSHMNFNVQGGRNLILRCVINSSLILYLYIPLHVKSVPAACIGYNIGNKTWSGQNEDDSMIAYCHLNAVLPKTTNVNFDKTKLVIIGKMWNVVSHYLGKTKGVESINILMLELHFLDLVNWPIDVFAGQVHYFSFKLLNWAWQQYPTLTT